MLSSVGLGTTWAKPTLAEAPRLCWPQRLGAIGYHPVMEGTAGLKLAQTTGCWGLNCSMKGYRGREG